MSARAGRCLWQGPCRLYKRSTERLLFPVRTSGRVRGEPFLRFALHPRLRACSHRSRLVAVAAFADKTHSDRYSQHLMSPINVAHHLLE